MSSWLKARLGRMRVSTLILVAAFLALFWVHETFQAEPTPTQAPAPAVVPPGFVPDPNYTWVPRTNVRRPKEPSTTTPTTTTTTTTSPTETTSPTPPTPSTTVVPGPLGPTTYTLTPTPNPSTVTTGTTPTPTSTTVPPP